MMKWKDLSPDADMVKALDEADKTAGSSYTEALSGGRTPKHAWSNAFADACARMIASKLREDSRLKGLKVLPSDDGSSEPTTFVAGDKQKRVDVIASSIVSGLQIGFSLKAMNFRDQGSLNFDKNLTGRTYELQDEVRVIHEYQPAAFMVALYFLPLAATDDKKSDDSKSSFARAVEHLRARTGRLDPSLASQHGKVDMAVVALYVPDLVERKTKKDGEEVVHYESPCERGCVRFLDVRTDPPMRGRPKISTTMNLSEMVTSAVDEYFSASTPQMTWSDPEE